MRIKMHIIAVEDCGDEMKLRLQGHRESDADWRSFSVIDARIPSTKTAMKAFYLGRTVTVEIKP